MTCKPMLPLALTAALTAAFPTSANTLSFDPGTPYVVNPAMQDFSTSAEQMAGMQMKVVQGGVTQLYTWGVLQDDFGTYFRGGVITPGFAIYATGDTWCPFNCAQWLVWTLGFQAPITQITFYGATAGAVFDLTTTPADNFGTPGSAKGYTFEIKQQSSPSIVVNAVYRNEVSVGAAPVVGDLYTTLELNFAGAGLQGGQFIQFGADTDLIPPGAVILPAVPEPSTWALWAAGLVGMGWLRQRRRR